MTSKDTLIKALLRLTEEVEKNLIPGSLSQSELDIVNAAEESRTVLDSLKVRTPRKPKPLTYA